MNQLKKKGNYPSLENTTHNRVLKETSQLASELADKYGCSKIEFYRWLVQMAAEEGAMIEALSQGQLTITRKDSNEHNY